MNDSFQWMANMMGDSLVAPAQVDGNLMTAEVSTGDGRTQLLFVMEGDDYWLFASPFSKASQIDADRALDILTQVNMAAGMRKFGELYCITRFLDKGNIQAAEIIEVVARCVAAADALENALGLGDQL